MLKGRKSRLISIFVVTGLIIGSFTVFAKQSEEIIKILYSNIKIMIDGVEYEPKDANGYPVEPFIYNGTTYLPVRGIANAFGSSVNWNPETMTVSLGSSKFDWLEQMGYVDYYTDSNLNNFKLYSNEKYSRGIKFSFDRGAYHEGTLKETDVAKQKVTYKIDKRYNKFYTTLVSEDETRQDDVAVKFYGDNNKLLYASPSLNGSSKPVDINFDVSGYDFLYVEASGVCRLWGGNIILDNARFSIAE